jgi:hypothetical protein
MREFNSQENVTDAPRSYPSPSLQSSKAARQAATEHTFRAFRASVKHFSFSSSFFVRRALALLHIRMHMDLKNAKVRHLYISTAAPITSTIENEFTM